MHSKKLITKIMLCLLALVSLFSVVGCKDPGTEITERYLFENQLNSIRYYIEQGYPEDWILKEGTDGYYIKKFEKMADGSSSNFLQDCGLVAQLSPKTDSEKVKYSIYTLKFPFMTDTAEDIFIGLLGEDDSLDLSFNNLFIDDEENNPRAAFVWNSYDMSNTDELISSAKVYYNKYCFYKHGYSFTVDGVDWKGMMFFVMGQHIFHIVTFETEATVWDAYYSVMDGMLADFRLRGWEKRE